MDADCSAGNPARDPETERDPSILGNTGIIAVGDTACTSGSLNECILGVDPRDNTKTVGVVATVCAHLKKPTDVGFDGGRGQSRGQIHGGLVSHPYRAFPCSAIPDCIIPANRTRSPKKTPGSPLTAHVPHLRFSFRSSSATGRYLYVQLVGAQRLLWVGEIMAQFVDASSCTAGTDYACTGASTWTAARASRLPGQFEG